MWSEETGEEIYFDNLGDLSIDQHIDCGIDIVVDVDQYYSGVDETLTDQLKYVAVGNIEWSIVTVDWAPAVGTGSADAVRADCTPEFAAMINQGTFNDPADWYTCVVKCRNGDFAIAGDSAGHLHHLNLTTGVDTLVFPPTATMTPIQRILEGPQDTIFAWDQAGYVHWFTINKATGVMGAVTSYNLTGLDDFERIIDVCKSPDGSRFVFTIQKSSGLTDVYYTTSWKIQNVSAPIRYVADMSHQEQSNVVTGITTQAMAFIDNSRVIVFSNNYLDGLTVAPGDIYLIDLNVAAPNGTNITANLPLAAYYAVGFTNNGDYGILTGILQQGPDFTPPPPGATLQQESLVVWKVAVTSRGENASISLTPLYRNRFDCQIDAIYRMYRMRKRHNSEQWFIISNEWGGQQEGEGEGGSDGRLMSIGEKTETPEPSEKETTSTSITLKWSKPEEEESEENIAFVRVMRSESCEPDDWECVFASENLPCEYIDNQHPTISPRDIDPTGGVEYVEVGLVDQVSVADGGAGEIHSYDPSQDTYPDGRKFFYKVQWISYLGIVSESDILESATAKPIQPVQIDDTVPKFSGGNWEQVDVPTGLDYEWTEPYDNVDIQSEQYTFNWDWTDLFGSIEVSQFDRWEVAVYEAQYEGSGVAPAPEYIEPRWDGTEFVFPWRYNWAGTWLWMCDRGAVVTDSTIKTATIEKLQNYDSNVLYEWAIIPFTTYRNVVVGWDKGGLWRLSAKVTRGETDWDIDRQVLPVHTLPKPSGVFEIEDYERTKTYDSDTSEFLYKDWIAYDDGALLGWNAIGNVGGGIYLVANEFTSTQEHDVIGYRVWVHSIIGAPSDLVISIYSDTGGGLPNAVIAGSQLTIPAADVQVGLNTVYFTAPTDFTLYARDYHVVVETSLGALEPLGNSYRISTAQYAGEIDGASEINAGVGWVAQPDRDLRVGVICSGYASDSIVLDSGYVSRCHTDKSTDASLANLLYRDKFVNDAGVWDTYRGVAPTISGGYMEFSPGVGQVSCARLDLDNIGTETRNYIVKFDLYMVNNVQDFEIWLRTQTEYQATDFTTLRLVHAKATGAWTLYQHQENVVAGSTLATALSHILTIDTWHTIIVSVIEGSVMLFIDFPGPGIAAIENIYTGFSALKGRILDTGTYPFNDHGYPFIFCATDDSETIRIDNFEIYGLPNTNQYTGSQGFFIDYGDESESGYFSLDYIDKTYSIDPDDRLEEFEALTHPINEFDQEDYGMPEIDLTLHPSMTIDVKVINSVPIAAISAPDVAYVDKTIFVDLSESYDPDGGSLTYYIDWGDGITDSGTSPQFTHTYTVTGDYQIDVYVVDELTQTSATVHHDITIESILNDLYELIPNFGFESVTPSRANGSSVFNLPDQCGGETHSTKGGAKAYDISGYHLDPCCANNLITEWTVVETFDAISSWIESDGPNGGQAMEFEADNSLFGYATQLKIRVSLSKTSTFDGDIEVRLATGLNPIDDVFTRGESQIIENADIPEYDGDNHYFDLEFSGCPVDIQNETVYLVITPVNATAGAFRLRRSSEGQGWRKMNGSNTWGTATTSNIYMRISVYNDPFDMAICEHLLFDSLHCEGDPFKLYIPGFGEKAVIMTQYSSTKDSGGPKWMKYSMKVVEQSTEALTGV